MKDSQITQYILLACCIILFGLGMYILIAMTKGQVDVGAYWAWLLFLPTGFVGILILARDFRR